MKIATWKPMYLGYRTHEDYQYIGDYTLCGFQCSCCNYKYYYPRYESQFKQKRNYCPNCGSKMLIKETNAEHFIDQLVKVKAKEKMTTKELGEFAEKFGEEYYNRKRNKDLYHVFERE